MMALSMPLSSPERRTLPPVARDTPGWEPNTISVRPTRTWSPSFRLCLPDVAWSFDSSNVEVILKVLDGRPVNQKFWVFYGALSNVEYTLTVTDTQTGAVKIYKNPSGQFGSVADTGAF